MISESGAQSDINYRLKFVPAGHEREMVMEAMDVIQNKTCIKFIERSKHVEHIEFRTVPNKGCYAMIGKRPGKKDSLPVNLEASILFFKKIN